MGNSKDIKPYIDTIYEENIILTKTEGLMMNGREIRDGKGKIIY
jgi:type IV secretion system protein VirD4